MRSWAAAFSECDRTVAQILLTHEDVSDRKRRQNAMQTMTTLLASGVIPIVNENDTVAVEEIRFGDNDMLSSLVASMVQAQMLVILSDVAGVLTGDPRKRPDAHLIPLITNPEAEMKGLVAESTGPLGTGGMAAKLKAAQQAARAGIAVIIAPGREPGTIAAALDPAREIGTLITPAGTRLKSRKHWIAFALKPSGRARCRQGRGGGAAQERPLAAALGHPRGARRVCRRRLREPDRSRRRRVRARSGELCGARCREAQGSPHRRDFLATRIQGCR